MDKLERGKDNWREEVDENKKWDRWNGGGDGMGENRKFEKDEWKEKGEGREEGFWGSCRTGQKNGN